MRGDERAIQEMMDAAREMADAAGRFSRGGNERTAVFALLDGGRFSIGSVKDGPFMEEIVLWTEGLSRTIRKLEPDEEAMDRITEILAKTLKRNVLEDRSVETLLRRDTSARDVAVAEIEGFLREAMEKNG